MAAVIVGLAGSVRRGSFNAALLRAAAAMAPAGTSVEIASIGDIPLYNGDVEAEHGIPATVVALQNQIAIADGLLLVTPEYNGSIPGVFKNAIDWLSRPAKEIERVFGDKPVALMGATPGRTGTRLSQTAWLPVIRQLGMRPWFKQQLFVASAGEMFDAAGNLTDPKLRELVQGFIRGFAASL
jgi:NAD(P)H-dependent FMN reductase